VSGLRKRVPLKASGWDNKHEVPFDFAQGMLSTSFGWCLTPLGMTILEVSDQLNIRIVVLIKLAVPSYGSPGRSHSIEQ
jgi:hypothetical protein